MASGNFGFTRVHAMLIKSGQRISWLTSSWMVSAGMPRLARYPEKSRGLPFTGAWNPSRK